MQKVPPDIPPNLLTRLAAPSGEIKLVSAAVALKAGENSVHVAIPAGTFLITLPPVASCPGEAFMLRAISDGGGTVTINDAGADGAIVLATVTFDASNDWCVIKNYGGEAWFLEASVIA